MARNKNLLQGIIGFGRAILADTPPPPELKGASFAPDNCIGFAESIHCWKLQYNYACITVTQVSSQHGRQSWGGWGGRVPPSFWSGGDEYLIIPPPPLFDMFNEILFLGYLKT